MTKQCRSSTKKGWATGCHQTISCLTRRTTQHRLWARLWNWIFVLLCHFVICRIRFTIFLDPTRCLFQGSLGNVIQNGCRNSPLERNITSVVDTCFPRRGLFQMPMSWYIIKVRFLIIIQSPRQTVLVGMERVVVVGFVLHFVEERQAKQDWWEHLVKALSYSRIHSTKSRRKTYRISRQDS